jgi:Niemann-Pick C1 protein
VREGNYVGRFIEKYYVKALFTLPAKIVVVVLFAALVAVSGYSLTQYTLGMDQQSSLPFDSYLRGYFDAQAELGEAGPPVYVVLREFDVLDNNNTQGLDHMMNGLDDLTSSMEPPFYSWLHGFTSWRFMRERLTEITSDCPPQPVVLNKTNVFPLIQTFTHIRVESMCCQQFGFCGEQYQQDIDFKTDVNGVATAIRASRLRGQHTALPTQKTFIDAMWEAQEGVKQYTHEIHSTAKHNPHDLPAAFPYSLYYVFFEQYAFIRGVAVQNTLLALGAVFLAALFLTNVSTAVFISVTVFFISFGVVGVIYIWNQFPIHGYGVRINAVSVVNMVMAMGLSVEFVVHVASAFLYARGTREERAKCVGVGEA